MEIEPAMSHRKLVIVPTYNELENISDMVRTVMELEGNFELLVIDDGSPDGTASVARPDEFSCARAAPAPGGIMGVMAIT